MRKASRTVQITLGLALLLAPVAGWGQSEWHYTAGGDLRAVKFIGNEGWAVGAHGLIIHTTDRGAKWTIQLADTVTMDLSGVSFVNNQYGWTVGNQGVIANGGVILKTRDGGQNWQAIPPPSRCHYYQVCFIDTLNGWATTQFDSIISTTDGGSSWSPHMISGISTYVYFPGVDFLDTLNGFVAGDWGVYKTRDGGRTWQNTGPIGFGSLVSVDFADSLHGWTVTVGLVAYTSNGGNNWITQNTGVNAGYESISFADATRGYIVGGNNGFNAVIGQTTNSGQTWNVIQNLTTNNTFHSVHATDSATAHVVGIAGAYLHTTNGGGTWQVVRNVDIKQWGLLNTSFYDPNLGWATGQNGVITHTTNGGTIWRRQASGTFAYLFGVDFPTPLRGWTCSEGGEILTTTDGGNAWTFQTSNTTYPLYSMDFADTNTLVGVAVGGYYGPPEPPKGEGHGSMGAWENGGKRAEKQILPLNQVQGQNDSLRPWGTNPTPDPSPKALGGERYNFWKYPWKPDETALTTPYRTITRTTNGGALWIAQNSMGLVPLYGVSLVSPAEGWACGDPQGGMGVILHTTDSGATWQGQTSNVNRGLYWIQFRGRQNGWCVGDAGTALWTTDGGITWNPGNSGTTQQLLSCAFYDALNGFACGANGLLLKTTDGGRNWQPDTSQVHVGLSALRALDSTHVWAVGGDGMVLGWRLAGTSGVETRGQGDKETRGNISIKAWPNPFVSYARVPGHERERFALYDITGRRVGTYQGDKIGADATAGIYFLMAENKEDRPVRIVKVR